MPRPTRAQGLSTKRLQVRLSEEEMARLVRSARRAKLTMSEYIRVKTGVYCGDR